MKLFDYLASSKVIIASSLPVLKEILIKDKNCIFIENLNIYKWKNEITKISNNSKKMHIIAKNNYFLSKQFTYRHRVHKLLGS